jgi:hypothetical protein
MRYDGRGPFATYAYWWIKKRCEECARLIKNAVYRPELRKLQTIPIERLDEPVLVQWRLDQDRALKCFLTFRPINPFENPYSIDYRPAGDISYSTPIENDDNDRVPEEWVVGRLNARSKDVENDIDGANLFDSDEVQAAAYESAAAEARALRVETLALTLDARTRALLPRELQVIRARFPWAIDVKNAPHREEELREYQPGHKRYFPKEHTLPTIGDALTPPVCGEWVRRIEERALEKMRASTAVSVCSREMFWGAQPYWNKAKLKPRSAHWLGERELPLPDFDQLIDRLVRLIAVELRPEKETPRFDPILCDGVPRQGKSLSKPERNKYLNSKSSKDDRELHKFKLLDARGIPGGRIKPFDTSVHEGHPPKYYKGYFSWPNLGELLSKPPLRSRKELGQQIPNKRIFSDFAPPVCRKKHISGLREAPKRTRVIAECTTHPKRYFPDGTRGAVNCPSGAYWFYHPKFCDPRRPVAAKRVRAKQDDRSRGYYPPVKDGRIVIKTADGWQPLGDKIESAHSSSYRDKAWQRWPQSSRCTYHDRVKKLGEDAPVFRFGPVERRYIENRPGRSEIEIVVSAPIGGCPVTWRQSQDKHELLGVWKQEQDVHGWEWCKLCEAKWVYTGNKKVKNVLHNHSKATSCALPSR